MRAKHRIQLLSERGQAAVELALALPLLLVVLIGMIDAAFAFNYWIDQTHLASTGARYAAVGRDPGSAGLPAYIKTLANTSELRDGGSYRTPDPLSVCVSYPQGSAVGQPVQVKVSSTYQWLPFLGLIGAQNLAATTISGTATMRLESSTPLPAGCS